MVSSSPVPCTQSASTRMRGVRGMGSPGWAGGHVAGSDRRVADQPAGRLAALGGWHARRYWASVYNPMGSASAIVGLTSRSQVKALTCMPCWKASSELQVAPATPNASLHAPSDWQLAQPPGPAHPARHSQAPVAGLSCSVAVHSAWCGMVGRAGGRFGLLRAPRGGLSGTCCTLLHTTPAPAKQQPNAPHLRHRRARQAQVGVPRGTPGTLQQPGAPTEMGSRSRMVRRRPPPPSRTRRRRRARRRRAPGRSARWGRSLQGSRGWPAPPAGQ